MPLPSLSAITPPITSMAGPHLSMIVITPLKRGLELIDHLEARVRDKAFELALDGGEEARAGGCQLICGPTVKNFAGRRPRRRNPLNQIVLWRP